MTSFISIGYITLADVSMIRSQIMNLIEFLCHFRCVGKFRMNKKRHETKLKKSQHMILLDYTG